MNALQKALQRFREQAPFIGSLSQPRRQMLMAAGMTSGEIDRALKADPVATWDKMQKSAGGGMRSLAYTMLRKGYSRERIQEMLKLEDHELWDYLGSYEHDMRGRE